jgi:ABC-2 type transport system permease protein
MNTANLTYRTLTSARTGPWRGATAIARVSLGLLMRRKMFWALFSCSVLIFLFYFFSQYLMVFLENRVAEATVRTGGMFGMMIRPDAFVRTLRDALHMDGTADTYGDFMWTEGYIVMIVLAFAGSILIGNDFLHNSLPFYLSKPLGRRHYLFGKAMAVALLVNAMTTIPAVCLFLEFGFIDTWSYYFEQWRLLFGILAYGTMLTVTLSLLLIFTSAWLRKTVPLVMVWSATFVLARLIQRWLVDGLSLSPKFRLIDIWNNMYLFGQWCFGTPHNKLRPTGQVQPEYWEATLACVVLCAFCVYFLRRRVRAVEIIT